METTVVYRGYKRHSLSSSCRGVRFRVWASGSYGSGFTCWVLVGNEEIYIYIYMYNRGIIREHIPYSLPTTSKIRVEGAGLRLFKV